MSEPFDNKARHHLSPGQMWAALPVADHARREAFKAIKPTPKRPAKPVWRRILGL